MFQSKYFNVGNVVVTRGIGEVLRKNDRFALEVGLSLRRYCLKDWGDLTEGDKETNDEALKRPDDLYLLAAYETCKGLIWIITNRVSERAGDNATTILFPEER